MNQKHLILIREFLEPSPSAISERKFKAQKHIQIDGMVCSGCFRKTRSVMAPRFGFSQDSRIRFNGSRIFYLFFNNQKVIIMSATMDVDHFSKFFGSQVLYLEGRTHPINIHHRKSSYNDPK